MTEEVETPPVPDPWQTRARESYAKARRSLNEGIHAAMATVTTVDGHFLEHPASRRPLTKHEAGMVRARREAVAWARAARNAAQEVLDYAATE